jgi:two-component system response regulator
MKPVQILLVEDQAGDILLTRHVLAEQLVPVKVHVAMDGQQAVSMLADPAFLPDLIILDLNIPRISGGELLGQRKLRDVPVVVFSSLWSEANARRALELGASEYVSKPIDIDDYTHAVCGMIEKWATPNNNSEVNKAPA